MTGSCVGPSLCLFYFVHSVFMTIIRARLTIPARWAIVFIMHFPTRLPTLVNLDLSSADSHTSLVGLYVGHVICILVRSKTELKFLGVAFIRMSDGNLFICLQ